MDWNQPKSELPQPGEVVVAKLRHCSSGTTRIELLRFVDEDDCCWRTADDGSELAYDWDVEEWRRCGDADLTPAAARSRRRRDYSHEQPLRLGFIGLGEHQGRAHISHLYALRDEGLPIELVAAFDPNPEAFEPWPLLARCEDEHELVGSHRLDALYISSPDACHAAQLALAVGSDLHVFCEKPMAVSLDDLMRFSRSLEKAAQKGLVVSTCHPRRFDPPCVWLKGALPALLEQHGRLCHFDFTFYYHQVADEWKKSERKLLSDHFGHEIDIFRYLFGESPLTLQVGHDRYDGYEVTGRAPLRGLAVDSGCSFRFFGSRKLEEKVYLESMRLDFETASLHLDLNRGIGTSLFEQDPGKRHFAFPAIDYDVRFRATNRDFLAAIMEGDGPYLTHRDMTCNNGLSVLLSENGSAAWTGHGFC